LSEIFAIYELWDTEKLNFPDFFGNYAENSDFSIKNLENLHKT